MSMDCAPKAFTSRETLQVFSVTFFVYFMCLTDVYDKPALQPNFNMVVSMLPSKEAEKVSRVSIIFVNPAMKPDLMNGFTKPNKIL